MKKVLCALGLMFTAVSSALATTYPLTIENCGYQETFTRPPERVVALGQNTVEILLLLGLQKQVVASAFWPTSVLPQLAEQNAKIKTLTVEIPSLESVLAQNPDFVPAQLPLLLGPESKVARREDLATVGVNSYVSPGMCATKKATGDMYGSRQKLWDMTWLYQEISDFSRIFNVEDRGQALIADFKKREADLRQEFGKSKKDLSFVFWFSSASPSADAYVGGKNSASGFIASVLGGHNAITSETEWPTVSWESIIAANPDVIVVASLRRGTGGRAAEKNGAELMSVAAIETRRSMLLTGWCVLAAIVLALVIAVGVSVGELAIPLQNVFYAISNRTGLTAEPLNRIYESVIWDFRLSRALVAACCGAGLAICGVVLQSLLKNALAEPYVLGVSAGASTGAVSIVVLGIGAGAISLSAGAFAGAFAAFAFVALLTNGARGGNERTILAGVAASQLFNAITAYTISTSASAQQARDVMFWLLGSFSGVRWPEFQLVIVVVLAGLAVCLWYARALDAFTFGDDAAASLGIAVPRVRLILFTTAALITATIVSMAGSIGFVGLVVPHVMRFFFGPLHRTLLIASALAGAILMVLADIASRLLIAPQSLPVGVVTALVGVPFFAVIIYRSRNK